LFLFFHFILSTTPPPFPFLSSFLRESKIGAWEIAEGGNNTKEKRV
jgi:hypothetical protein